MQDYCHVPFSMRQRLLGEEAEQTLETVGLKPKQIKKAQMGALKSMKKKYDGYDYRAYRRIFYILLSSNLDAVRHKIGRGQSWLLSLKLFKIFTFDLSPNTCNFCQAVDERKLTANSDEWQQALMALPKKKREALLAYFDLDVASHQKFMLNQDIYHANPKRLVQALDALAKSRNEKGLKKAFEWIVALEDTKAFSDKNKQFEKWVQAKPKNRDAVEKAEEIWISFSSSMADIPATVH